MSEKIYIKRSVKEKLPDDSGDYFVLYNYHGKQYEKVTEFILTDGAFYDYSNNVFPDESVTHWLEEMELEEYLCEINYTTPNSILNENIIIKGITVGSKVIVMNDLITTIEKIEGETYYFRDDNGVLWSECIDVIDLYNLK